MADPAPGYPLRYFRRLPDPRAGNARHRLIDILVIALGAILCDADGWDDIEDLAKAKADWFATFMDLAIGFQKAVAKQITDAGGDYVLAVKENHKTLHGKVKVELDDMIRMNFNDLSSHDANAAALSEAIRGPWGIENSLHPILDVSFHEDDRRTRNVTNRGKRPIFSGIGIRDFAV